LRRLLQQGDIDARKLWEERSDELGSLLPARAFNAARLAIDNFDFDAASAALPAASESAH
jgi:hypothetical protein